MKLQPRDDLTKQYPRWRWSQSLRDAVDRSNKARRFTSLFTWPLDVAADRLDSEFAKAAWNEDHYQEWDRDELTWRILFLQGAARSWWARYVVTVRWVVPLAVLAGISIGVLVAR